MAKEIVYSALAVFGAFIAFLIWLSNTLGADLNVTASAVGLSVLIIAVAFSGAWLTEAWQFPGPEPLIVWQTIALPAHWVCWFGVLDSIALGGSPPNDPFAKVLQPHWYNNLWTKWGVFLVLSALSVVLYRKHRASY